jgi:hypothetical protein
MQWLDGRSHCKRIRTAKQRREAGELSMNGLMNGRWRGSMANEPSTMTFEEFIQSTMNLVDRVLAESRASENQLIRSSALAGNWSHLPHASGAPKGH